VSAGATPIGEIVAADSVGVAREAFGEI